MPKGARSIRFSFGESHLTHFGGMWLIQRFCNKLQLQRLIQRYVKVSALTYQREFLDASRKVDRLRLPRNLRICK